MAETRVQWRYREDSTGQTEGKAVHCKFQSIKFSFTKSVVALLVFELILFFTISKSDRSVRYFI